MRRVVLATVAFLALVGIFSIYGGGAPATAQGVLGPQGDITAVTATAGGGLTGGGTKGPVSLGNRTDCSTDEILQWDGDSWECAASGGGGGGDITAVNAGTNMDGGGSSGSVTLDLEPTITLAGEADVSTIEVENTGSLQTSGLSYIRGDNWGTFDTDGGALNTYGVQITNDAQRDCGGECTNALNKYGGWFSATSGGGGVNYALYTDQGSVWLSGATTVNSGLTVNGGTALGDSTTADSHAISGAATFTSGGGSPVTAAYNGTTQTNDRISINATNTGTYNTTGASRTAYGLSSSVTATESSGSNTLTNIAVYANAASGDINYAYYSPAGLFLQTGAGTFDSTLTANGTLTASAAFQVNGNTTLGNGTGDSITVTSTPIGINGYDNTVYEWNEEWLAGNAFPTGSLVWPMGGMWIAQASAASLFTTHFGTTTRPGMIEFLTGSSGTGRSSITTSTGAVDFGSASWTFETVIGFPTLSTSGEEYAALLGFVDDVTTTGQVDGCYFMYDRGAVAADPSTGADATGDTWKCWCANNSTRTEYVMDGAVVSDESFTTVASAVAAYTAPSTNIYRLKIVMTGTTRAEFYINGTKRCNISTNIPSGSSRRTGMGHFMLKSNGSTSRSMDLDFTRVALTLNSARSP